MMMMIVNDHDGDEADGLQVLVLMCSLLTLIHNRHGMILALLHLDFGRTLERE